jgi:phage terminase small subunit
MTPKEHRFCEEYIVDLNATQAAIRAGYSRHTARSIGSALLTNLDVTTEIERLLAERSERTGIDADWLLTRLAAEAEADVADLYGEDGELLPVKEWPLIWRKGLVAGIDVEIISGPDGSEMGMVKKIKVSDRAKRLEMIGKHVNVKAFEDRVMITGLDSLADRLDRAAERVPDAREED